MSDEIEAAGALATVTLAASVIEAASPVDGAHGTQCANCNAVLADAESALESARAERRANTLAVKAVEAALALPAAASAVQASPAGLAGLDLNAGNARVDAAIRHAQQNPELTL